ncbi:hypothetical protein GGI35DRAFT_466143 [Trichoderma velutinum]
MSLQSAPKTGKLRRTCEACAHVKIKCTKEKPTCSRCKNRGIACQYFIEKRPGRRRQLIRRPTAAEMDCCSGRVGNNIRQPSGSSLLPNSVIPHSLSTMPEARGAERITTSITSGSSYTVTNMITNCDGCFESPHLSENFMSNGPFNNGMVAADHSSIFSAFDKGRGSMSAGLVDTESEMDRLGFFRPSTVSERYQPPSRDIDLFLMPIEDTTEFTPVSEPIHIQNASLCGCCSSTSRSEISPARFSCASHSTASIAAMSTSRTSPADFSETLTCECLDQALQLLKKVSGSSRMSSSSSSSSSGHSPYSNQSSQVVSRTSSTTPDGDESSTGFGGTETRPRWFQATLSENRQCLGIMDNILACSGTDEDSMLPLILCMILLKILDRYSNVAWSRPLPSHNRNRDIAELGSNMRGYIIMETGLMASTIHRDKFTSNDQGQMQDIHRKGLATSFDCDTSQPNDDDYSGLATAHLVLGELHWVQRVVNQLVVRLKCPDCYNASRPTQQICGWESRQQSISLPMEEPSDPGLASLFSAATLEQIATDVQKRLTALSSSIINQLRQS